MSSTVDRALEILELLEKEPCSIAEVARRFDIHPTTALRILQTLEARHFVRRVDGAYRLGPKVISLGYACADTFDIRDMARDVLEWLSAISKETVHLAAFIGGPVIYLDKIDSMHPVRMYSVVGKPAPIHCTAVAKAIMAFRDEAEVEALVKEQGFERCTEYTIVDWPTLRADLHKTRERGYAISDRDHHPDITCIAAPIRRFDGIVESSISIAAPSWRLPAERLIDFAPELLQATQRVAVSLGWFGDRIYNTSRLFRP